MEKSLKEKLLIIGDEYERESTILKRENEVLKRQEAQHKDEYQREIATLKKDNDVLLRQFTQNLDVYERESNTLKKENELLKRQLTQNQDEQAKVTAVLRNENEALKRQFAYDKDVYERENNTVKKENDMLKRQVAQNQDMNEKEKTTLKEENSVLMKQVIQNLGSHDREKSTLQREVDILKGQLAQNLDFQDKMMKYASWCGRNLLKNGDASDGFNHWQITKNLGDKFIIENSNCGAAQPLTSITSEVLSHCWVTSFDWCEKEQTIDLLKEGCDVQVIDKTKPKITVSEWTTGRNDCGSTYIMKVYLLDSQRKELTSCTKDNTSSPGTWAQIMHIFADYPAGVRYIKFTHAGKDSKFWKGHFGSKFTGASVKFSI